MRAGLRVAEGPVVEAGIVIAEHAGDHQGAHRQKDDDGHDLDSGKPVFRFGIDLDRQKIQSKEHREKTHGPERGTRPGKPELHDERTGHQLRRQGDRPAEPVVPTHCKSQRRVDETLGVRFERTGNRQMRGHLAERLHHAKNRHPHGRVGHERAARPGLRNRSAAGEEQAGADRTADRNHAQLPGADAAAQFVFR